MVSQKSAKVVIEERSDSESGSETSEKSDAFHTDSDGSIDEESKALLNEGWADSIAKILRTNKPKKKKTLVLSKAKKLTDPVKKILTESYEVATEDGRTRRPETITEITRNATGKSATKKIKKSELSLRLKPSVLDKDRERALQRIAARGAVQLFNAVRLQRSAISRQLDEAGPLSTHKDKVLKNIDKRAFLDVLMGEKSETLDGKRDGKGATKREEKGWDVFREDFRMGAKMKDWDKETEDEREMDVESE